MVQHTSAAEQRTAAERIRGLLVGVAILVLVGLVLLVAFTVSQLASIDTDSRDAVARAERAIMAGRANDVLNRAEIEVRTALTAESPVQTAAAVRRLEIATDEFERLIESLDAVVSPTSRRTFDAMATSGRDLLAGLRAALDLTASGSTAAAAGELRVGVAELSALARQYESEFVAQKIVQARAAAERASDDNSRTRALLVVLTAIGSVLALAAGGIALRRVHRVVADAERFLTDARDTAEDTGRLKDEFLASMSHEFRTPLNGVIGMLSLLDDTDLPPEARKHVDVARRSASDLLVLVNDVLDISKLEAGTVRLVLAPVAPSELVREVVAMFSTLAAEQGDVVDVVIETPPGTHLSLDPVRVRQVLVNLVGNALKFTVHGRVTVRVTATEPDGSGVPVVPSDGERILLTFAVSDTGRGIEPDLQRRLFNRFAQGDESGIARFRGAGLGLAISRRLTELMGGEIDFESEPGAGSRFWFTVPSQVVPPPAAVDRAPDTSGGARLNVLVAEDNAVNQLLMTKLLERLGHDTVVVDNGRGAVEALDRQQFDLVLMDIQMPGMDGIEATRMIRARSDAASDDPIVALTANVLPDDVASYLAAGMDAHLPKPLTLDALRRAIGRVLGARRTGLADVDQ